MSVQVEPAISPGLQPGVTNQNRGLAASAALLHEGKPLKQLLPSDVPSTGLKPGANGNSVLMGTQISRSHSVGFQRQGTKAQRRNGKTSLEAPGCRSQNGDRNLSRLTPFAVLSLRVVAGCEDFASELERRFSTGPARWVAPSRLETGAPLGLRLRRAMPLRLALKVPRPTE